MPRDVQLRIAACVTGARRARVEAALGKAAALRCFDSVSDLRRAGNGMPAPDLVIIDGRDGASLGEAHSFGDAGVVIYASVEELARGAIASAAISEVIVADETDGRAAMQRLVFNTVNRRAADQVARELRSRLPDSLALFAETAVRFESRASVEAVSDHLGIHRQTAAVWCRKHHSLHPEALVIWSRLLLVAALLEKTDRSLGALALDLDFPSVTALRNTLKRYTGLTALQIRAAGFGAVLRHFEESLSR